MKTLSILLLALTFSNAYAGSFIKTDKGMVSWSVEVKSKNGQIELNRSSAKFDSSELSDEERMKVSYVLGWSSFLGTVAKDQIVVQNSDERSQETIASLITKKMHEEASVLNVSVKNSDIQFEGLNCKESGLIKRKLNCSAHYISTLDLELKK